MKGAIPRRVTMAVSARGLARALDHSPVLHSVKVARTLPRAKGCGDGDAAPAEIVSQR